MKSIHLLPVFPRKAGSIQIKEAFKQLVDAWSDLPISVGPQYRAVYWGGLESTDGQIFKAGISVLTGNPSLWPWEETTEDEVFQFSSVSDKLLRAGALIMAESARLQKQANAASETQWYVKKDELRNLAKRADELADLTEHIGDMLDAVQLSVFMNPQLQVPSETR